MSVTITRAPIIHPTARIGAGVILDPGCRIPLRAEVTGPARIVAEADIAKRAKVAGPVHTKAFAPKFRCTSWIDDGVRVVYVRPLGSAFRGAHVRPLKWWAEQSGHEFGAMVYDCRIRQSEALAIVAWAASLDAA